MIGPVLVEDRAQVLGVVADLLLGQRHGRPVALPGRVVDLEEARDLGVEVALAHRPADDPVLGLDLRGHPPDRVAHARAAADVQAPHQQVHRLLEPLALEQRLVVGVVPGREDDRRALVALDQQAALVVGREVHRADHPVAAALAQPRPRPRRAARARPRRRPRTRRSRTAPSRCPGTR